MVKNWLVLSVLSACFSLAFWGVIIALAKDPGGTHPFWVFVGVFSTLAVPVFAIATACYALGNIKPWVGARTEIEQEKHEHQMRLLKLRHKEIEKAAQQDVEL